MNNINIDKLLHVATPDDLDMRVDKLILKIFPKLPHSLLHKIFRKNLVLANKKHIDCSYRLKADDNISLLYCNLDEFKLNDVNHNQISQKHIDFWNSIILTQTQDFIAINKPSGIAVQGGTKISFSIDDILKYFNYRLVHRLDRDTSGILLVAKNQNFAKELCKIFSKNCVKKTYIALVEGIVSHSGKIENFLKKIKINNEDKVAVYDNGSLAITYFSPITICNTNNTLLKLTPETGRTHQLRVHCASCLKTPIIGDKKYGSTKAASDYNTKMCLHAQSIVIDQLNINISTPLPAWADIQ